MAVTVTKVIVILVLWVCLIGVGYLTSTGNLAKALNLKKSENQTQTIVSQSESKKPRPQAEEDNWLDYDPMVLQTSGLPSLPIASKRIAHPSGGSTTRNVNSNMNEDLQRWTISTAAAAASASAGIKSSGSIGNGGYNDNDNNAIKVSSSLHLNGPSPPSSSSSRLQSQSHLKPTSSDPDLIATQVHEPIMFSQDEKYQIINGVEEESATGETSRSRSESNISPIRHAAAAAIASSPSNDNDQRLKEHQHHRLEAFEDVNGGEDENSISTDSSSSSSSSERENDNEKEATTNAKYRTKFLSTHFLNSNLVSGSDGNDDNTADDDDDAAADVNPFLVHVPCKQLAPVLAALVYQIEKQGQDTELVRQFMVKQEQKFDNFMMQVNQAVKRLALDSSHDMADMKGSVNQQLKIMNERLEAGIEKIESASLASQIILQLSKESFHQMDRIQETADDVLFHVRALKTELSDVGQTSVQAIYNIQRSEENLMKQLGESWNRTIYALRQEPGSAAALAADVPTASSSTATSTFTSTFPALNTEQQMQPPPPQAQTVQPRNQQDFPSSAPSPTFFAAGAAGAAEEEEFIQADSLSSINRNDDGRNGMLPSANDERRQDAGVNTERKKNMVAATVSASAANNNSQLKRKLSPPNHTKGLVAAAGAASAARESSMKETHMPCSSRKKLINPQKPRDCSELQLLGGGTIQSGLFNIYPYYANSSQFIQVYCDLASTATASGDGGSGGWTVIQRRGDYQVSRENFQRSWQEYENGFGSPYNHFWIGLLALSSLTASGDQILRIEMTDWDGVKREANYGYFRVSNASDSYRLFVTDFVGNAGDSLTYHNGMPFSTLDRDNDMDKNTNCAQKYRGGWWYRNCHQANLNGLYLEKRNGKTDSYGIGINWYTWHGYYYSLKEVEMKIRNRNLE